MTSSDDKFTFFQKFLETVSIDSFRSLNQNFRAPPDSNIRQAKGGVKIDAESSCRSTMKATSRSSNLWVSQPFRAR